MSGGGPWALFLLGLWTVWVLAALPLLGRETGAPLLVAFALLGVAVAVTDQVSWRTYVMLWLATHAGVAAFLTFSQHRRRYGMMGSVSLLSLLWLWIQGGAAE